MLKSRTMRTVNEAREHSARQREKERRTEMEWLNSLFPNVVKLGPYILKSLNETLIMVSISGVFAAVLGVPLGVVLAVTKKGQILSSPTVYSILSKIVNTVRSIPFVILIASLVRAIVGTTIGLKGAIVPLIIACIPFMAKQTELALQSIDQGVIEAYRAMGFSEIAIIFKVMLKEGFSAIIQAVTIMLVGLISYSAVAGSVGGGGLGDFAIRYGYGQNKTDVMVLTIIIMLVMVFFVQWVGDSLSKKVSHQ